MIHQNGLQMSNEIRLEIKRYIKSKKLTQDEVGKLAGISRITVNRYLGGRTQIGANDFINLIHVIGWSISRGDQTNT
jgi:transcriptional regulator with XRE-family HTH domain